MFTKMRFLVASCLLAATTGAALAQTGLRLDSGTQASWPRWHARLGVATQTPALGDAAASGRWQPGSAQLLGDYYPGLSKLQLGTLVGGFRATSGLLLGPRQQALVTPALASAQGLAVTQSRTSRSALAEAGSDSVTAMPYIGVGYSGVSLRGGWGFTADLGVLGVTGSPSSGGGLRPGRGGVLGTQGLDDLLRELRLLPVLQVGVSYAF